MAKDVFISYKSEDFEQAEALRLMLESRSISCMYLKTPASAHLPCRATVHSS